MPETALPGEHDQAVSPDGPRQPRLILFDVNETLSDMRPVAQALSAAGAPAHLAGVWFAGLLRDGFALTVTGASPAFAELAADGLRGHLAGVVEDVEGTVEQVMAAFAGLPLHPDVVEGVQDLHRLGITLATLSIGAASIAQGLLERGGIADCFERVLSVADATRWKPAAEAYRHALDTCGFEAAEAMLVAVHPWDIHGAHEAGLATGWVNRAGREYPSYFRGPDLEATSLVDLAAQLGASGG